MRVPLLYSSSLFDQAPDIVPERLKRAREMRSLTQAQLARQSRLDQSYIAHLENGERRPSEETLHILGTALQLPADYFLYPVHFRVNAETLRFRASPTLGKRITATLKSETEHYLDLVASLLELVNSIPVKFRARYEMPRTAARRFRVLAGVGSLKPFEHLIRHFERLGGIIIALSRYQKFEAFADWTGDDHSVPLIALTAGVDPERLRMTIGHEIGHLVLHKGRPSDRLAESEAFEFATELLFPEIVLRKTFASGIPSIEELIEIRDAWGISAEAVVYSANRMGFLTQREYRTLNVKLRVMRKHVRRRRGEQPRAIRKMAEVAFGTPLPYPQMENTLHISAEELRQFFERYAGEENAVDITKAWNSNEVHERLN